MARSVLIVLVLKIRIGITSGSITIVSRTLVWGTVVASVV